MLNCFQLEKADRNTQIPRTPSAHSEITESLYLQSVFRSNAFVPVTSLLQTISLQLLDSAFTWSKGLRRSRKVLSEICIIFQIKRKPNPIIVLWFNQNHLYFKNKQKPAYLSTIGVPNRVSQSRDPDHDFEQSRNPEGYFWHPTSRAYFQSRIPPWFCCKIPNPELQIREIPYHRKPIGNPLLCWVPAFIICLCFGKFFVTCNVSLFYSCSFPSCPTHISKILLTLALMKSLVWKSSVVNF